MFSIMSMMMMFINLIIILILLGIGIYGFVLFVKMVQEANLTYTKSIFSLSIYIILCKNKNLKNNKRG